MIYGLYINLLFHTDGYVDISLCCAWFGRGTGLIHINNLGCSGTENKLTECSYIVSSYQHNEDWSVTCMNGKN